MAVKAKPINVTGIYFITFTCFHWISLLEFCNAYHLVYEWFDWLYKKDHRISGYVLMPNHIHLLLYYSAGNQSLNTIIGNGKRFMAYGIIKRLRQSGQAALLQSLQQAVPERDRSRGTLHEVWEDSFDVKHCRSEKFILQKLNYLHFNPCTSRWKLAKSPVDYPHSSAAYYELGGTGYPLITDYRKLLWKD